jgi:hypothetical protein
MNVPSRKRAVALDLEYVPALHVLVARSLQSSPEQQGYGGPEHASAECRNTGELLRMRASDRFSA